jgi:RNA polymerase sigma-70 factor (ECF subfamily)
MGSIDRTTSLTLLERVRGRDEEAWRNLLRLYGPLVDRWCGHWSVRGPDADDIRQDVFQAVAQGLDNFRREPTAGTSTAGTFRGWLRIITRNKLVDFTRRKHNQPEAQGGSDAQRRLQEVANQELPDDTEEDLSSLYHRALELVRSEFEARTWEAFWRSTVDGQAPAVIAADLGVTAAAVRKAKSRVLHRLRQEVGDLIV